MRIAFITQSYLPMISGTAFVMERLGTVMSRRGRECLVIAASDHPSANSSPTPRSW